MSDTNERMVREELITKLKGFLEAFEQGDLFMDENGDVFETIEDAVADADVGDVVKLVRFIQLPEIYVAVNASSYVACATKEEAEDGLEEEEEED